MLGDFLRRQGGVKRLFFWALVDKNFEIVLKITNTLGVTPFPVPGLGESPGCTFAKEVIRDHRGFQQ